MSKSETQTGRVEVAMTKTEKLRIIAEIMDWNEDLQACENGPVTAQAVADFDSEYDWGSVSYGDAVIAYLEAQGVDLATATVKDQARVCRLVEGMYWTAIAEGGAA